MLLLLFFNRAVANLTWFLESHSGFRVENGVESVRVKAERHLSRSDGGLPGLVWGLGHGVVRDVSRSGERSSLRG